MSESVDNNDITKEGSLWKMKKGITGSVYWKRNWVLIDYDHLYQWQTNSKPRNGEAPKYTCQLGDCNIEETQLRKFSFKITEKSAQKSMVFAADDFDTYEAWLRLLFGSTAYSESSDKIEQKSDASSDYSEEFKQFTSDKISDFFFEHDVSKVVYDYLQHFLLKSRVMKC